MGRYLYNMRSRQVKLQGSATLLQTSPLAPVILHAAFSDFRGFSISCPDRYDVSVLDHILLAFEPPNPGLLAGGEISVFDEIFVCHRLRSYESFRQVGVN